MADKIHPERDRAEARDGAFVQVLAHRTIVKARIVANKALPL